jgi:ABC-type Fe3+-siderophore transport system permease subunit
MILFLIFPLNLIKSSYRAKLKLIITQATRVRLFLVLSRLNGLMRLSDYSPLMVSAGVFFVSLIFYFSPFGLPPEILSFRLSRAVEIAMVGATLSLAGLLAQTVFKNDLADPFNLGISGWTGLGILICSSLGWQIWLGAVLGSVIGGLGIILLALKRGVQGSTLILAGVVLGFFASALMHIYVHVLNPDLYPRVQAILLGDFVSHSWSGATLLWLIFLVCLAGSHLISSRLDVLLISENFYYHRYGNPRLLYFASVLILIALISVAVLKAGIVGFVGLVVPHIGKRLWARSHAQLVLPISLLGAGITLVMDRIGQSYFGDVAVPFGVISMILGAPIFVMLVFRGARD